MSCQLLQGSDPNGLTWTQRGGSSSWPNVAGSLTSVNSKIRLRWPDQRSVPRLGINFAIEGTDDAISGSQWLAADRYLL